MANAFPTPDQINEAMSAVAAARQDPDVPAAVRTELEKMSNVLQDIQDALIEQTEQDLVDALTNNNAELVDLTKRISSLSADLNSTASTIQTVSTAVGTVVSVIAALV